MNDTSHVSAYQTIISGYECHIWIRHGFYEWVMLCMNESCHIWISVMHEYHVRMSHVVYEWVMSHYNESCHIWTTHHMWVDIRLLSVGMSVTYEWVLSHMNKSYYIWITRHMWVHVRLLWVGMSGSGFELICWTRSCQTYINPDLPKRPTKAKKRPI